MKKRKYWLFILIILLVGCSNKIITKEEFMEVAKFDGYQVKEDKTGYEAYNDILNVIYAIDKENAYDIQFLELKDDNYAQKFFLYNKNSLKVDISSGDYEKSKSTSDYELYHAETVSKYLLVIRSGANIIYVDASINYINQIEEFLSDLDLEY